MARSAREPLEVRVDRGERLVPARERRAARRSRTRIGLGLGDASPARPGGPLERAGGVAAAQPAARGVVGVVGGEPRVAVVELLEQLARVGPVRLVGPRQREQVGRRQPLVAVARERLQRRANPASAPLQSSLRGTSPRPAWRRRAGRTAPARRGRTGPACRPRGPVRLRRPGVVVVIADRLRERGAREGERERRRGDRRAARDAHQQTTNRARHLQKISGREGQVSRERPRPRRRGGPRPGEPDDRVVVVELVAAHLDAPANLDRPAPTAA